jgi:hypothetical protein
MAGWDVGELDRIEEAQDLTQLGAAILQLVPR